MSIAPVSAGGRTGEWRADPGFGVYVHIPFCRHRCHYCDFNTYEGQDAIHAAYVDALVRDVERWPGETREATSVFFGGGTPTLLHPADLGRILRAVRERVGVAQGAEVTVEANPETVDRARFEALLEAGFNRVSIGIQSAVPHVLARLGRTHSVAAGLGAVEEARLAGFQDVNADLIYGSSSETASDWSASLQAVIEAGPDHVSAYALTLEEGTPLATLVATGREPAPNPDVQAERHATASRLLAAAGYLRYEVSNWARPGHASAHNLLYWSAGDYLGFGAGAHGHLGGRRYWSLRLPRDLIAAVAAGDLTEAGHEELGPRERATEALVLGLRLASGIDLARFRARFGSEALDSPALRELVAEGWVEDSGGRLRLADRAVLLGSDITCRLL